MKRFLWIVMASITLLFCAVGCKSNKIDIHKESMNITALMEMKVKSEDYWQLYDTGTPNSFEKDRAYLMANDYDRPIRCYRISKPNPELVMNKFLFRENEQEKYNNLPDELKNDLKQSYSNEKNLFQLVINDIQFSIDNYRATFCNTLKIIENATLEKPIAYLYIFETGKPIIVEFSTYYENAVSVRGYFLVNSEYKTLSQTRDVFEPYGCTVEIEFDGSTHV